MKGHTVLLGPRAAVQAKQSSFLITHQSESRAVRKLMLGYRHVIISDSSHYRRLAIGS